MQEQKKKISSLSILSIAGVEPYKEKKQEKYMNKQQLIHFRKILNAWYNQIKNELGLTLKTIKDAAINFPDPIDRANQEEEFSFELRNRDRQLKLIKKIENTLKKIKENRFGYCDTCGIEIGLKRLEASPTADLCIDCKTLAEIREKQISG